MHCYVLWSTNDHKRQQAFILSMAVVATGIACSVSMFIHHIKYKKMETKIANRLAIPKQDQDVLIHYLQTTSMDLNYDRVQAEKLLEDIKTAEVVPGAEHSRDMIRLNSSVTVRNTIAHQNQEYTLVLPGQVDHQNHRLSILSPLGSALLGKSKGETVKLHSARGTKLFTVLAVTNPVD